MQLVAVVLRGQVRTDLQLGQLAVAVASETVVVVVVVAAAAVVGVDPKTATG